MKKVKYLSLLLALALLIPLGACNISFLQDSVKIKNNEETKKDINDDKKDDNDEKIILDYNMNDYLDDYHDNYGYLSLGLDEEHGFLMQQAYTNFYDASKSFLLSDEDWEIKSTTVNGELYKFIEVYETKYFDNLSDADYYRSAWSVFVAENPIFYFLNNGILTRSKTTTVGQVSTDSHAVVLVGNIEFATFVARDVINKKLVALFEDTSYITAAPDSATRARGINNYIKSNLEYAYKNDTRTPEDSFWAHSIIGILVYNKGVCECYSKAFKLLADRYDVYSIQVYGYANLTEAHAWNYVKINDVWYGVDVTWNENFSDKYLLCSKQIMDQEHYPYPTNYGIQYQPTLPELATSNFTFEE